MATTLATDFNVAAINDAPERVGAQLTLGSVQKTTSPSPHHSSSQLRYDGDASLSALTPAIPTRHLTGDATRGGRSANS